MSGKQWRGLKQAGLVIYELHVGTFTEDRTAPAVPVLTAVAPIAPPASMASPSVMDRFMAFSLLVFRKIRTPAASSARGRAKKMRMHL